MIYGLPVPRFAKYRAYSFRFEFEVIRLFWGEGWGVGVSGCRFEGFRLTPNAPPNFQQAQTLSPYVRGNWVQGLGCRVSDF